MAIEPKEVNQKDKEDIPIDLSDDKWYKYIITSEWTILPLDQPDEEEGAQDAL